MSNENAFSAVMAGLARSSSRVADCNYDKNTKKKKKEPQGLLACFFVSAAMATDDCRDQQQQQHQRSRYWPRSPSHIMSRLLLSPDMSPDNRMESPRRGKSRSRVDFSSRLNGSRQFEEDECDEPVSPKVTCMGTVKAAPRANNSDLIMRKPLPWRSKPVAAHHLQPQQQQQQEPKKVLLPPLPPLPPAAAGVAIEKKQQLMVRLPSKKADEVCIWKRRCVPEPVRLAI